MSTALAIAAGYLIGSIDFGVIIPRLLGVDIYEVGSGNPGATNVLRAMGKKAAALVMVGDLIKGLVAALIGDLVGGEAVGFGAGLAAVVGHCFPIWHRLRGGKGVATAAGALLWLEPIVGAGLLVVWVAVVGLTRRASVASLVAAVVVVPGLALTGHRSWSLVWAGGMAALVIVRHHANIRRLLTGSEHAVQAS